MRVSVLNKAGETEVTDRPAPEPGPEQVLVRVASVGVCGSDVHYFEHGRIGSYVVREPLILGHEASGVIEQVGSDVDPSRVGQRVSIEPGVPCRSCQYCLSGHYNLCPKVEFYATPPFDGAFAELVLTHHAFAHPVPDALSDDAAALIEPLSVALWAAQRASVTAGDVVLVTGAGPVGLLMVAVARALGAAKVYACDINEQRLAVASRMGATDVVHGSFADSQLQEPTVLLEGSGHPGATIDGIKALAPAGRAILVGMGGDELNLPLSRVQERELIITGTFRYAGTWPAAIELAASGAIDLDALVSGYFGLDQVPDALQAAKKDPSFLKAMVRPAD
ncbi:MAG: NAD(P)-dependent alcohol dehydrogenase [Actinomycetota bacterium]|nr:NAD(P)-dependent alcohol dehydrogenase [Actinomycetota bacterium]